MTNRRTHFDVDAERFPAGQRYTTRQYRGVAVFVWGWETTPDEDTEWSGYEARTGRVLVTMVGDDRRFAVEEGDLARLEEWDYCAECGQVGCGHDGRDRSAEA